MSVTVAQRTPGVNVTELDAFPPSVIGVQTAVPIFIGYTEMAVVSGKPVYNTPVKINSLADYETIFGKEFDPKYTIDAVTDSGDIANSKYDFKVLEPANVEPPKPPDVSAGGVVSEISGALKGEWKYYSLKQTNSSKFYLYNSMRFFYENGGGACFVVSVGDYAEGGTTSAGAEVELSKLQAGLNAAGEQAGPTIVVIPDAVLLPPPAKPEDVSDFQTLVRAMLAQCATLQDRVAILDVYGTLSVTSNTTLESTITQFRKDVDVTTRERSYGMAYFPWLVTNIAPLSAFDYTNIDSTSQTDLTNVLNWQNKDLYWNHEANLPTTRWTEVDADIKQVDTEDQDIERVNRVNENLKAALPVLADIERVMTAKNQVLPPSGAMAGIFTANDATKGVWNAPANVTMNAVSRTTYELSDEQQGDLNVPVDGIAVDALREFEGRGTVVWGARTLDGNSADWRYIQVRRTFIYVEQSIKTALTAFVFAANDGNTWTQVTSMISGFLQGLWEQGGLVGATADEAFSVQCGLGSTMTAQDILEGFMIVQVVLQMIRPAEFIKLTIKQKLGN